MRPMGGDGYPLVTVGGEPYWGDAIGQIPYAVGRFKHGLLESGENGTKATESEIISATLADGQKAAGGFWSYVTNTITFGTFSDESNNYDNHFILRGAHYASKRYNLYYTDRMNRNGKIRRHFNLYTSPVSPQSLSVPINSKP